MTEIENKFNLACELQSKGQQEESYRLLFEGYLAYCNNPSMLNDVTNYALVGNCLFGFYFMPTIQNANDSIKEQVSSICVLFLSKAIDNNTQNSHPHSGDTRILDKLREYFKNIFVNKNKDNKNDNNDAQNIHLRSCRIHMLDEAREYIKHIFVESGIDIPFGRFAEKPTRRALTDIDKIIYSELVNYPAITSKIYFSTLKTHLENDRLVPNRFQMSTIDQNMKINFVNEGNNLLSKFISFLDQKVCINGDIDFDTEYD